jgi:large subunit ribosomal protein L4e
MFSPNKIWRKWHHKINVSQRRYAVASALAASAIPALVMARGHKIETVPEVPLVVSDDIQSTVKTQKAIDILTAIGADSDVNKVKASAAIRRGVGKSRNRRYVQRRGPLLIYNEDNGLVKAFRNVPGVDTCCVTRLNLLQLAPGGHLGRFCIWTKAAFERLDSLYGTPSKLAKEKTDYHMPRSTMSQADLHRIINSDEIQSVLKAKKSPIKIQRKKNPLRNLGVMAKLNPFHKTQLRRQLTAVKKVKTVVSKEERKKRAAVKRSTRARLFK